MLPRRGANLNEVTTAGDGDRRSHQAHAQRKRESIRRLKLAQAEGRLTLKYQPIFAAADGRALSAEALLRWRRPEEESDDLSELLLAAERSPVIFALEAWAIEVCFRDAAAWQSGPLPDLRVNLNLSAREFHRADLLTRLTRALAEARLDPARLTLEVTETSAIHEPEQVSKMLERLRAMDLQLWLDDFGTGHSSLAWLSWFRIDGVKIPGLFVSRLPSDERCAVITSAVIDMAHRLGLGVTAEGIETDAQLAYLKAHGCDALQGFLLGEARDPEELVRRLTAG
jgi:EAL domain-containing protein (putative c-di-GMP-specific phosphodiesterase class I)